MSAALNAEPVPESPVRAYAVTRPLRRATSAEQRRNGVPSPPSQGRVGVSGPHDYEVAPPPGILPSLPIEPASEPTRPPGISLASPGLPAGVQVGVGQRWGLPKARALLCEGLA